MINLKQELNKFNEINVGGLEKSISDLPDDVKNSVKLYNKALESLKKQSEDIAIIELKKAVSLNPNFNEAINLLGLCYIYTNEKALAQDMFSRVIESESNGIKAFDYLKLVRGNHADAPPKTLPDKPDKQKAGTKKQIVAATKTPPPAALNAKKNLLRFILGVITGLIIMLIIAGPHIFKKNDTEALNNGDNDEPEVKVVVDEEYKNRYDELSVKHSELKNELKQSRSELEYVSNVRSLLEIQRMVNTNNLGDAADKVVALRSTAFTGIEKDIYDTFVDTVLPREAERLYDEAWNAIQKDENYEDGLELMRKVSEYAPEYKKDGVLYYTGKCYQHTGELQKAMDRYNEILEKFPRSVFVKFVNYRISEIQQVQGH